MGQIMLNCVKNSLTFHLNTSICRDDCLFSLVFHNYFAYLKNLLYYIEKFSLSRLVFTSEKIRFFHNKIKS